MWKPTDDAAKQHNVLASAAPVDITSSVAWSGSTATKTEVRAFLGKAIKVRGEIIGSESLCIEGHVEGSISIPESYVNIGPEAQVCATVIAGELVIRGEVTGNVFVADRLDIRSGGSLSGDVVARGISIEDGAYFKGSIDMRPIEQRASSESHADSGEKGTPICVPFSSKPAITSAGS